MNMKVEELFKVCSGDFHATAELDPGNIPLISCGDTDNGLVGYFDIPETQTYKECLTVAYNGSPLLTKYHSYRFGAKDDVAVLTPLAPMKETTLLYIATLFNRMTWRYSYGRKCFRQKLEKVTLSVPVVGSNNGFCIDEDHISQIFPKSYRDLRFELSLLIKDAFE